MEWLANNLQTKTTIQDPTPITPNVATEDTNTGGGQDE
jgi:hypothetical protein